MIYKKAKIEWEFVVIIVLVALIAFLILKAKGHI